MKVGDFVRFRVEYDCYDNILGKILSGGGITEYRVILLEDTKVYGPVASYITMLPLRGNVIECDEIALILISPLELLAMASD